MPEAPGTATVSPSTDPAPVQASETPASASTEAQPTPGTADKATPTADWRSGLDTADPKDILGHKRVAGIFGERLQAERSRIKDEVRRELDEEHRRADLARTALANEDSLLDDLENRPLTAAEQVRKQMLEARRQREDSERLNKLLGEREPGIRQSTADAFNGGIQDWAEANFPTAVIARFQEKVYEGTDRARIKAWLDDLHAEDRRLERAKWEREAAPALEKDALTRVNGGDPVPDTDAGRPSTNELTLERWTEMSAEERRKIPKDQLDRMTRRLTRGAA